jgi:hypothetical protein
MEGCCTPVIEGIGECVGSCAEAVVEELEVEERGVVEIVEEIVGHQSRIKRLLRALKKLCCEKSSDSEAG